MLENEYALLLRSYPQLRLPLSAQTGSSAEYTDVVLRGNPPTGTPCVPFCREDSFWEEKTEVGAVRIWRLANRESFEHALQALAYRCDPREIPESVGAQYIGGLINWELIRRHKREYIASGGEDWKTEFRRFTQKRENYTDSLILLSSGFYSGISPEKVGMSPELWEKASAEIRRYHELTHFVYRKCCPGDVDVIRDEVLADCVGLCAALDRYDARLARIFLGIENGALLPNARLRHYVPEEMLPQAVEKAELWVGWLDRILKGIPDLSKRQRDFL